MNNQTTKNNSNSSSSHTTAVIGTCIGLVTGAFLMLAFMKAGRDDWSSHLISLATAGGVARDIEPVTASSEIAPPSTSSCATSSPIQLESILHYATSKVTPQQSLQEIKLSYNVLKNRSPCNFLVFGLGYDSLMWASLNPNGHTLFLEESPGWVQTVLKDAPYLKAETVSYRTQLHEADGLLATYRQEPECLPRKTYLKGNRKCRLALDNLPEEVYEKEWDVIMVDAPRGYFREAPGRMAAIYSAAVMARGRKRAGKTHVYLHDVDRKVEKEFAREFLCMKYKVGGVGRLWHFEIPSVAHNEGGDTFC